MTLEIVAQRIATLEEQMVLVMSKINSDEPKAKGKKAKKDKAAKADAPPKKKRGTTGYLMFASDARHGVKEELIGRRSRRRSRECGTRRQRMRTQRRTRIRVE